MEKGLETTTERDKELDFGATFFAGIAGTVLIIVVILLVQAFYHRTEDQLFEEAYAQPVLEVKKVQADQLGLIGGYLVQGTGAKSTIRIPIDRAIELVAREGAAPPIVIAPPQAPAGSTTLAPAAAPRPSAGGRMDNGHSK